ncbi:hypothetical protein M405DRAFT_824548 [Rhizopogon salebrosus TDB-379]|nr:hypothetical protein M405DRAFT_824548 [Rhizopogon salebrosus TDB-379]
MQTPLGIRCNCSMVRMDYPNLLAYPHCPLPARTVPPYIHLQVRMGSFAILPSVPFSGWLLRRDQPDTECIERKPVAVEVPYIQGKARNIRVGGEIEEGSPHRE